MLRISIFFMFLFLNVIFFAQNKKAIDAVNGVGEYKWGMKKELLPCTENEFGWCVFFPQQFFIAGHKVFKIKTASSEKMHGLYIVSLYLDDEKIQVEDILKKLKIQYGEPTKHDEEFNNYEWFGDKNMIFLGVEHTNNVNLIRIHYEKLEKKQEVGY
jgi:hypothetical protein